MSGDPDTGDRARPDGGTVSEEPATGVGSGSPGSALDRLRERDDFVVIATAVALVFFPFLLVNVLGAVGELIGLSIGGYTGLASLVLIYGVVVIGFNLLLGYTGLLSFGHAAFFGSAAYAAALFSQVVPSPLLMVVVGTLVATILAWPIGFVSIRRSGVYFAVLTLTFGQALYFYALGPGAWLTNGDNGFSEVAAHGLFVGALPLEAPLVSLRLLDSYTVMYAFASVVMLAAVWVANRVINSPYGLIFEALGENEQRVEFVGLNVFRYKLMAFIISAVFAGVGGSMFLIHEQYIHPTTGLYWIQSGDFVIMTVLGGTGSLMGPVFGAFIFEYVANVISGVSLPGIGSIGSLWRFVLGAVFVFIVWVFPEGVYGAVESLVRWAAGGEGGSGPDEPAATDGGDRE